MHDTRKWRYFASPSQRQSRATHDTFPRRGKFDEANNLKRNSIKYIAGICWSERETFVQKNGAGFNLRNGELRTTKKENLALLFFDA